jgi:hypothetical protein
MFVCAGVRLQPKYLLLFEQIVIAVHTPSCADTRSTPSRRFSMVVAEEPAQPLAAPCHTLAIGCHRRIDHHIPQSLMVSLLVVVLQIL